MDHMVSPDTNVLRRVRVGSLQVCSSGPEEFLVVPGKRIPSGLEVRVGRRWNDVASTEIPAIVQAVTAHRCP